MLSRSKKTTDAQRAEIIAKHQAGVNFSELARQYGVFRMGIAMIAKPDLLRLDTSVESNTDREKFWHRSKRKLTSYEVRNRFDK
jgi:tetrahydromethanopterin S-methyltransferase subunit F